jgi:hypothetical protein
MSQLFPSEDEKKWIGFVGKIFTGNPWVFTIKLLGFSGSNFNPSSNSMINGMKPATNCGFLRIEICGARTKSDGSQRLCHSDGGSVAMLPGKWLSIWL